MKIWVWGGIAFSVFFGLGGCSNDHRDTASTAAGESAPASSVPPAKVLLPAYAATGHCLSTCVSKWWRLAPDAPQDPVANFTPEMPLTFAELLASPEEHDQFVRLIEQFPQHLHPVGILQPWDDEKLVDNGTFGSYRKEKPKMWGNLDNVINNNGKVVYVYSGVHYFRLENKVSGTMHVAIDPATHEYAGLIRAGDGLDEYYIAGAESLRSTLLAFTIANDLEFAEMSAHYAKKNQGRYLSKPIMFPLNKDLDEAMVRVELLNDKLGNSTQATGIPEPSFLLNVRAEEAKKIWYGVSQGRDRCIESPMSPAGRIELIKEAGVVPRVRETNANGKLAIVEVSAVDGGYESTWRFFKNKADCEQTLATVSPTPDRYR